MSPKLSIIEALLRKAEATTNAHEAEAFTAKAEEMMIRHGIDEAMLNASHGESPDDEIIQDEMVFTGAYSHVNMLGAYAVMKAFSDSLRAYKSEQGSKRTLFIVGYRSDISAFRALLASLTLQNATALKSWWPTANWYQGLRSEGHEKFMARRSFIQSFYSGAAARLRETRRRVTEEMREAGTDVALRDRAAEVQFWLDSEVGRLGKARGRGLNGGAGSSAGYRAGQSANLGGTSVGQGRRSIGA